MELGVFSVCLPEYGLDETVRLLKAIGYDAVEWRVAEIQERIPDDIPYERRYWVWNESTVNIRRIGELAPRLKGMCDDAGLSITGFDTYLTSDRIPEIVPVLEAAKAAGVRMVRLFADRYAYDSEKTYSDIFSHTRENIRSLEALAAEYGVKIVFEIHHDSIAASASAAMRLIEGSDPERVGVIVDPGNMVYEGYENYRKVLGMLGPYVAHVHIKNAMMAEDGRDRFGARRWKRVRTPLWDGQADLPRFIHELKAIGYDGAISLEDFCNDMDTPEKLRAGLGYIRKLWAEA